MEESIREALRSGDVEAARQLVVSQEWQDLSEDTLANLLWHAANYAAHAHQHDDIEARIRFVRLLLARDVDPSFLFRMTDRTTVAQIHESNMLCEISALAGRFSPRVIDLLIRWGASVDHAHITSSRITKMLENGGKETYRYSVLAYAVTFARQFRRLRAVAIALLRGGASLDSAARITAKDAQGAVLNGRSESIEWVLGERERREPLLVTNAHYLALKAFLLSVRAAGDYRSFVIEQRRTCALVRHLALRDRATTRDGVLKIPRPHRRTRLVPTGALVPIAAAAAAHNGSYYSRSNGGNGGTDLLQDEVHNKTDEGIQGLRDTNFPFPCRPIGV